jgi:CPA2 family monovalent cation:H+ antiporter-2
MARGEFSIVIAGLATLSGIEDGLGALATSYVLILAIVGPVLTRYADQITAFVQRRRAAAA